MNKIVGIQFKQKGKVYDFDSGHFVLGLGDKVMVITDQGPAIGCVCTEPQARLGKLPERALKKVFRLATPEEVRNYEKNSELEEEVYTHCYTAIRQRELPMSLVAVERQFDGSKIIVYFTAEGRVDFRDLVKDLVKRFRSRVEMRQIGVRHQAKMVGGLGTCGRPLCCASFLSQFAPVTIKMAKEQYLSLSPGKISGMCGRLMCCLTYEQGYYEKMKRFFPKTGKTISTRFGEAKVVRQNVLRETVTVLLESGQETEIGLEDMNRPGPPMKKTRKE